MVELYQNPNTAVRQTVKEVILTKIIILSAQIASMNELVGGGGAKNRTLKQRMATFYHAI